MKQRTCKAPHVYGGRAREVGERFPVEPGDVEVMLAMGRIEREKSDSVPGYVPRDMAASWAGGYATRDMTSDVQGTAAKRGYQRKVA